MLLLGACFVVLVVIGVVTVLMPELQNDPDATPPAETSTETPAP